ncbi:MAG: protein meaA [Sorangiineae bacterium]|nr:protein meaA [Polyangiaceae bacterium]MEB2322532.1 protein meaA [Sorangiineae bacterium]
MADQPWIMRTYSGHSTPKASNELYRANLARGQTGLSVAFDLPTQLGYDSDAPEARGEVGRTGVPICHLGDMRALFDGIALERMNTSMTINATAAWLLALYVAAAEEQGASVAKLRGTTQNDIIKEYLSRGTYIFPPAPSLRLIADVILFAVREIPDFNPTNVCSYHLQEAGATPEQEIAYALSTAIAVLDAVRARGVEGGEFAQVFGRLSFFLNSSIRFVDEVCKERAFTELWDRLGRERYEVAEPALRRFRYGVQVNSLGLTEQQPENNIVRIAFEMLGVTLSRRARARAVQLPAWNEALGLPRPWDQQLSLRTQQILAFETDLLEHGDLFDGSRVVEARSREIAEAAWAEVEAVLAQGGAVAAVESGYIKERLVAANAARLAAIESGARVVVGVNRYTESAPSPLTAAGAGVILEIDPEAEREQIERLRAWRAERDAGAVARALGALREAAASGENVMPASIAAAKAGVTTGEWAGALREVFGEYRAPTGVGGARSPALAEDRLAALREEVSALEQVLGRRPRLLIGKPGLDGHSNGAEQIALRARDAGFEVVYQGIRSSPSELARSAVDEGVHLVGLSVLSGAHLPLVREVLAKLRERGAGDLPVVAGGIIPEGDAEALRELGVARVFTPKDFDLSRILTELVAVVKSAHAAG